MIPKPYRFHSRGGVRYTYKYGKTIHGDNIKLIVNPNSRSKQRFAVVVSKKVLKSAVGRNRIRRRIYEAIRLELPNITKPLDCIFVVYSKDFQSQDFTKIRANIHSLLKRAATI